MSDIEINDIRKITDFKKSLRTKWIYLASLMDRSFQTAKEISKYAEKKKIKVLFNPSLYLAKKGKVYLKPILKTTSILVLNQEEAAALLGIKGKITKKYIDDGEFLVDIDCWGENQKGEITMPGHATVSLPSREKGVWPLERLLASSETQ